MAEATEDVTKMTAGELRAQTDQQLDALECAARAQLLRLNEQAAQQLYGRKRHADAPHLFKAYRRLIARIQTVRSERKRQAPAASERG